MALARDWAKRVALMSNIADVRKRLDPIIPDPNITEPVKSAINATTINSSTRVTPRSKLLDRSVDAMFHPGRASYLSAGSSVVVGLGTVMSSGDPLFLSGPAQVTVTSSFSQLIL